MEFFDKKIVFCGDVHGSFGTLGFVINKLHRMKNTIVFVCGDFGMGFNKPAYYLNELGKLSKQLKTRDNYVIVVRGNHDDPVYFNEVNKFGSGNVILITDYEVVTVNGYNILGIGGGISIDRTERILDKTYWKDEPVKINEEKLLSLHDIDVIFTHSSPNFCKPFTKDGILYWIKRDVHLIVDCDKERADLTYIYEELIKNNKIQYWYYGHFHESFHTSRDETIFIGLNELELKEFMNYKNE